jgi:putative MFS transporter
MTDVPIDRKARLAVLVASLGYLVDIYDLILFSIVGGAGLDELRVPADQRLAVSMHILNMQMLGMLVGGLLWGILGDRRGRLSVLFGSIILYSLANIANGFVQTTEQFAWLRFIAGVGLAGELGAGVTLVVELLDKRRRGAATTIIAGVGVCGALLAYAVSQVVGWRTCFFIGGGMGLALLVLRIGVAESGMFATAVGKGVSRGNFFRLFTSKRRAVRYVCVILCGVPIWYAIGILMTNADKLGAAMGMDPAPKRPDAVFWGYVGLAIGDFAAGALSQLMKSRKRALAIFIASVAFGTAFYFLVGPRSVGTFYAGCTILGVTTGYWAVFVTVASEQFGTNLRATATTTSPNFVRGSLVLVSAAFTALQPSMGLPGAAAAVGAAVVGIALVSLLGLEETYGKHLDYTE